MPTNVPRTGQAALTRPRAVCFCLPMPEKWLVTGGCGFLGSNLVASLLRDGIDVVVLDAMLRVGCDENLQWLETISTEPNAGKLVFVRADVRSADDVNCVFANHGAELSSVAHLAGQVAMTTSIDRPYLDFQINVQGSMHVLENVRAVCPKAVALFASTNKVYGDLGRLRLEEQDTRWTLADHPEGVVESTPLDFHSPYGCSKGAADQYFLDYHRMFNLKTVVFRHGSMYGGHQFSTFDQGWVGWFCQAFLRQREEAKTNMRIKPFTVQGDGKQVRDLLAVSDAVRSYRMAAQSPEAFGHAFNIGGGAARSLSLLELFQHLQTLLGHTPIIEHLAPRHSDQKVFIADIRKAKALFGWEPRVGIDVGLKELLTWTEQSKQHLGPPR